MRNDLHIIIHWLEEEITVEKRSAYEALDEAGRIATFREVLRKNSTTIGMRKQDVEALDDGAVLDRSMKLYEKYRNYIDRMERETRKRKRRR